MRGPLHGIPLLLKDNISTAGAMHTPPALRCSKISRPGQTRLSFKSCAPLGRSSWAKPTFRNGPIFMTSTSANGFSVLGGQVRNRYGKYDVSGSSSGSAAAVSAGLAPAAVGTETCGSLIAPGSANSLAVLKPTLGLVSRRGIIPITAVTDTAGPMARSVADLAVLLRPWPVRTRMTRSPNRHIPAQPVDRTGFLDAGALRGLRIGFVSTHKPRP